MTTDVLHQFQVSHICEEEKKIEKRNRLISPLTSPKLETYIVYCFYCRYSLKPTKITHGGSAVKWF